MNTIKIMYKTNQFCDFFTKKIFISNDVYYNMLVIKIILQIFTLVKWSRTESIIRNVNKI